MRFAAFPALQATSIPCAVHCAVAVCTLLSLVTLLRCAVKSRPEAGWRHRVHDQRSAPEVHAPPTRRRHFLRTAGSLPEFCTAFPGRRTHGSPRCVQPSRKSGFVDPICGVSRTEVSANARFNGYFSRWRRVSRSPQGNPWQLIPRYVFAPSILGARTFRLREGGEIKSGLLPRTYGGGRQPELPVVGLLFKESSVRCLMALEIIPRATR